MSRKSDSHAKTPNAVDSGSKAGMTRDEKSKRLTISIVIPAYNEADTITRCLEAIAAQTLLPDEVIVVDNNSTDGTAALASQYPFVRVITEKKQGVVHARNTGFNAAHGDIIGRIDADTIIAPDWVATLRRIFIAHDIDAITGRMHYHDVLFPEAWAIVDLALRKYLAWTLGPTVALQGANMAMRRKTWAAIRRSVCNRGGIHEDIDIGIHAYKSGHKVDFYETLQAEGQMRQAGNSWRTFAQYVLISPRTYAAHRSWRGVFFYPVVWLAIATYPLLYITSKGYDASLGRFSFRKLRETTLRVNPATFVD